MNLLVITPDKKIFEGAVTSSTFPGANGSFQVLKDHAPLISALATGELKYVSEKGQTTSLQVSGGVVEVLNNNITVLVETIL